MKDWLVSLCVVITISIGLITMNRLDKKRLDRNKKTTISCDSIRYEQFKDAWEMGYGAGKHKCDIEHKEIERSVDSGIYFIKWRLQ